MNGTEGSVGFILIGAAVVIVAYVLVRNESRRAFSSGRRRRTSQLVLSGLVALIGLGLVVVGLVGLVTG